MSQPKNTVIKKMKKQRNIAQIKAKPRNTQDQLNEEKIDKLSEK